MIFAYIDRPCTVAMGISLVFVEWPVTLTLSNILYVMGQLVRNHVAPAP